MISSDFAQDRLNVVELQQVARVCYDHENLGRLYNILRHGVLAVEGSRSMHVAGIFAV